MPKPNPGGLDPDSILDSFAYRMMYSVARDEINATEVNVFQSLAYAARDRQTDRWFPTQDRYHRRGRKRFFFLPLEFLLRRVPANNIRNPRSEPQYAEAVRRIGY